ncbi:MAG TPA: c-type cytochrome [Terriglobia bacterium]|nr:c-type cytochrome [Terriglobia bacterium]
MVSKILISAVVMALAVPTGVLALADSAEALFLAHCSSCHGASGEGGRGPRLNVPRLLKAPDDTALSAVITNGVLGGAMPGTRMTQEENRHLVAYVRNLGRAKPFQSPGDWQRGESLFWGKGNCGTCHTVGPRGRRMGPDLTEIGVRRGPAYLLTSLLDPEAEIPDNFSVYRRVIPMPDNFLQVRLVTADGKRLTGVRLNEDTLSIQLRDYSGGLHSFLKSELQELNKDWGRSPMPSYRNVLTEAELEDLVAYLASLRGGS